MSTAQEKETAEKWRERGSHALASARRLYLAGDLYGCASRAYYAVYQVCTAECVLHGAAVNFPAGWNNPTHDQLPDLIQNNGGLPKSARQTTKKYLNSLRDTREHADYRVGRTLEKSRAMQCLFEAGAVFQLLGLSERNEG